MAKKNKHAEWSLGERLIVSFLMFPLGLFCFLSCIFGAYDEWAQVQFAYMLAEKGAISQATILSCEDRRYFRNISYEFTVVQRPKPPYKVKITNEEILCFKNGGCSCAEAEKTEKVYYLRTNPQQALLQADHPYRANIVNAACFGFFGFLMVIMPFLNMADWWQQRRIKRGQG
jgi:hypothetical protein